VFNFKYGHDMQIATAPSSSVIEQTKAKMFNEGFWMGLGAKLLDILIVLVIAFIVTTILKKIIRKFFKVNRGANEKYGNQRTLTLMKLVESVLVYVVNFIVIIASLEALNVPITSVLAGAGVVGLAVGFGAQNLVKDIITGFFILLEDQFSVGDYVRIGQFEGFIQEIGLRTTRLKSFTGEVHILPNGSILSVTNFSRTNSVAIVDVNISYESDIKYAESVIEALLEELPHKYEDMVEKPQLLGVQMFGGSEVTLRITSEVKPMKHNIIARDLRKEIKLRLDQKGIEIPYPHMVFLNKQAEAPIGEEQKGRVRG
jgi:moderate conductance mechanosensitive channel